MELVWMNQLTSQLNARTRSDVRKSKSGIVKMWVLLVVDVCQQVGGGRSGNALSVRWLLMVNLVTSLSPVAKPTTTLRSRF